jgi:hypothetical protein
MLELRINDMRYRRLEEKPENNKKLEDFIKFMNISFFDWEKYEFKEVA